MTIDDFKIKSAKDYNIVVADRDNLKVQLQASETEVSNLKAMSVEFTDKISAFATKEADFNKQIEDLKAEHTKAISDLQGKVETESKSAEAKAQAIASSMGITSEDKLPKVVKSTAITPEYVSEQMAQDKTFFAKNKQQILRLAGIDQTLWNNTK